MRVLHVYRTYFPDTQGGLEEAIRQICHSTARLGVENRVYTVTDNPHPAVIDFEEASVYRFYRNFEIASCGVSLPGIFGFNKLEEWADIIHYHFPWPFADALKLISRSRKPSILTYHSDVVKQRGLMMLYAPLMRNFLGSMDRIVCTSPNYRASSLVLEALDAEIGVIPIGLFESSYPEVDDAFIEGVAADIGKDFFFFIGVLRPYKGIIELLDAVRGTGLPVVIAGKGPLKAKIRRKLREPGFERVKYLGYVDDPTKVALYRLAKAVVFPSIKRSEAFGVTLVEGAMFGKPLISTELSTGTSFVNIDGETGIVIEPRNQDSLRKAMETLSDTELIARYGENARARYLANFTGEIMGGRYLREYENLIRNGR